RNPAPASTRPFARPSTSFTSAGRYGTGRRASSIGMTPSNSRRLECAQPSFPTPSDENDLNGVGRLLDRRAQRSARSHQGALKHTRNPPRNEAAERTSAGENCNNCTTAKNCRTPRNSRRTDTRNNTGPHTSSKDSPRKHSEGNCTRNQDKPAERQPNNPPPVMV